MAGIHHTPLNLSHPRAALAWSPRNRARRCTRRTWAVESLEGRTLLSTWPVTTLDDSGDGSLRWAIDQANANTGDDTVDIQVSGTITLQSALADLSDTTGLTVIKGLGTSVLTVAHSGDWRAPDFRIFTVDAGVRASLSGMNITGGHIYGGSANQGGGILNSGNLAIDASTISGNGAYYGGGIYNRGTLTIHASTISGNEARSGGAIDNTGTAMIDACIVNRNEAGTDAQGILNEGTMTIHASTISDNIAGYSLSLQTGGGIYNTGTIAIDTSTIRGNMSTSGGGIYNTGTASILASTISGNSAGYGGGIYGGGMLTIRASTISGNSALYGGGIFGLGPSSILTSILARNSPTDADGRNGRSVVFRSLGHNLIGNTAGNSGWVDSDLQNLDPMLGPLQDNGGPTWTMALLPGSPAIDAGVPVDGVTTDQRGISRTAYGLPDIGTFEFAPLMMCTMVVDAGADQRSNVTTLAVTFNQWTNLQSLIDQGTIGSAVQLVGPGQGPLEAWRFHYDRESFTLTVDLRASGGPQTMLADGSYELRIDTRQVYALNNPTNPLADSDGTPDGLVVSPFSQLVGDFNGDGRVTLDDRVDFLAHYGTRLGQGLYDYCYDLNGDGIVNLLDYMAWVKRLGYTI